jgi:hypothetical protein
MNVALLSPAGELSEQQALAAFFANFQDHRTATTGRTFDAMQEVTFAEFEEFYEGVSIATTSDEEFLARVRSEWGL